ncbi:DUF6112 family protein [Microbacterium sp. 2FI]|uniref:DUF6112 family protein n=1 Tax=Microbacterium sp. 2FI TaxID=2502193 RepID=UPI0010F5D8BE|nr:DUF6112 family protein [Microbacterium sp. 2FI]
MSATIFPNFGAVGAAAELRELIGALLMVALIAAVLMLIVCAVTWALASSNGHYQAASRARIGVWVSIGTAAVAGIGVTWLNFLLDLGSAM